MSNYSKIGIKRYGKEILNPIIEELVEFAKIRDLTPDEDSLLGDIVRNAMDAAYRRGYTDGARDNK